MRQLSLIRHSIDLFEAGDGDRRSDCRFYDHCLTNWVVRHSASEIEPLGRCPARCEYYQRVADEALLAIAYSYSHGGGQTEPANGD